jgi:hypothetical protein
MKTPVVLGVTLVVGVELLMLLLRQRQFLLWTSGIAVALLLYGVRRLLGERGAEPTLSQADPDDSGDLLRNWMSGTEIRIHWSESTRTDWDRHWRPVLAQRFGMATGQLRAKDPAAFNATGRMLFGAQLWQWVDPANVARDGSSEPGPGRAALEEILQRLEQQ